MNQEEAIKQIKKEFKEFKKNNTFEFDNVTGYQLRNMELNFIKRRCAELLVDFHHLSMHNEKLTKLYVASEYELKQKNDEG